MGNSGLGCILTGQRHHCQWRARLRQEKPLSFPNLHASRKNTGPFWIDALCIDQQSSKEKQRQLKLMPRIYARAKEVLVWLGTCEGELFDGM